MTGWIDSATIEDPRVQPYCTLCWEPISGLHGDLCDECREISEWFPDEPAWIADHVLNIEEGRLCPSCLERREPDETLCPECSTIG